MCFEEIDIPNDGRMMGAEEALKACEAALTGDPEQDEATFRAYMALDETRCDNVRALRAGITGYVLMLWPDADLSQWPGALNDYDPFMVRSEIEAASDEMSKGNVNSAVHASAYAVSRLNLLFRQCSAYPNFDFENSFQAFLYRKTQHVDGTLYRALFEMTHANRVFGRIMMAAGELDDAIECFRHAIAWNPVDADNYLDIAVAYLRNHHPELHEINVSLAYPFICGRDQMRRYYFEQAAIYEAKQEYGFAAELYKLSLYFGEHPRSRSALEYLEKTWFKKITPPLDRAHLEKSCLAHHVPLSVSPDLMFNIDAFIAENPEDAESLGIISLKEELLHLFDGI